MGSAAPDQVEAMRSFVRLSLTDVVSFVVRELTLAAAEKKYFFYCFFATFIARYFLSGLMVY